MIFLSVSARSIVSMTEKWLTVHKLAPYLFLFNKPVNEIRLVLISFLNAKDSLTLIRILMFTFKCSYMHFILVFHTCVFQSLSILFNLFAFKVLKALRYLVFEFCVFCIWHFCHL